MNQLAPIASEAALPATYENARTALAACASIDECQEWADKAAALASYAKQANDDGLMKMAIRIRDRAIRRAGELLKQIEPQSGARTDLQPGVGTHTRSDAAAEAGMSRNQMNTALRVASVPAEDFDALVDSDTPPTVTKLASMGTKARPTIDMQGRDPESYNRALHFVAEVEDYAKALSAFSLDAILSALSPGQVVRVRRAIGAIDAIHDRIITRI